MTILRSIALAFAMFSRLPVPKVSWNARNMRYMMVGFPLVGAVIGLLLFGWVVVCRWLDLGGVLTACGLTLLPIGVTGGIHLDGFCDTVDALSSHADPKRKCEILKDPHTGAFAVIGLMCYLLLYFSLCYTLVLSRPALLLLMCIPVLSRVLSAFAVISLPCEGGAGTLHSFADAANKRAVSGVLFILLAACLAVMLTVSLAGGSWILQTAMGCYWWLVHVAKKEFGGMRGDLAGWFLQLCELLCLGMLVISQKGGWL
ncbi:adenosylcobinamide-GDP ribazoletransferase [Oscillospiraceae bacterium LTW-04]|nr:adenosylcobinamide-GDP ribazoletransferase [Oscillospiraceae bacterium MB24-C1]